MENYYYHQETGPVRKLIFSEYPNGYITTWAYDDYGYVTVSCSSENPPSINEMNLLSETWNTAAKKAGLSEIPLRFRDAGSGEIQRVYAFVPDAARINEWIRTVHENPVTASIRELLRQISGEEGYLCGWQYHPGGYLYVFSSHERLPAEDEMQKFVQVWNTAAANLPDIPVKFMKVYVPQEMIAYDQPITLDVVFPAEGEVVYGDVDPLATSVYVNVLSPNGVQSAWIESYVHQRESDDLPVRDSRQEIVTMSGSTGPIPIQQGLHAYTVTATDLKGNSATKVIYITVVLGLPSPSKFR